MLTAEILGPDLIIVIVVAVVVLLFGGSKLPKLARGLGSASHEFKKGLEEGNAEGQAQNSQSATVTPPPAVTPPPVVTPPVVTPPPVQSEAPRDSSAG